MTNQANQIRAFLLKKIPQHPKDIVGIAAEHFGVTRTSIHRHIKTLIKQNQIVKTGTTRQVNYYLPSQHDRHYQFTVKSALSEDTVWRDFVIPLFPGIPRNVESILYYGFTEIFNNAIDHAQAKTISVAINQSHEKILLTVSDDGIGVFERINQIYHFENYKESLLHLTKGRLTTDPANHAGEGLFFTSRIFDTFQLIANGLCFFRDNIIADWTLTESQHTRGTKVIMEISKNSTREIVNVFNEYTELENYEFCKTDLLVDLSILNDEMLISRSQAKRLLTNIGPFKSLTLDFSKVTTVGQGFVDEVFRVYTSKNPHVKIRYINANTDVEFMIKRGLPKT